jgi:hypothetical protein
MFGGVKAPPNKGGRLRSLTPVMIKALCDHLLEKPHLYQDEMAVFLWDGFRIQETNLASAVRLSVRVGQRRLPSKRRKSEMQIYGMNIFTISQTFIHTTLFTWMSPDVTNA